MKKIFLVIFILLTSFLFFSLNINAQENSYLLVPGINCGVGGDVQTNKCCAPYKFNQTNNFPEDLSLGLNNIVVSLGNWGLGIVNKSLYKFTHPMEEYQKKYSSPCIDGSTQSTSDPADINCRCVVTNPTPGPLENLKKFCLGQTQENDKNNCDTCIAGGGVWTGIGCVQGSINEFIGVTVFRMGIGLAGGFSLLCIIYAAFMMQSSQGNPEKLKKAQEMITSCIMGLMLIIFSVFILRLIGVQIIKIPGFT